MSDNQNRILERAVEALTKPWNDVLSPQETGTGRYQAIDYPPLLDMLRSAVSSSLGRTGAGRSPDAERNVMNLAAFSLWEHIDGVVRSWLLQLSKQRRKTELKEAVSDLAGMVTALRASNQMDEHTFLRISGQFASWRTRIWEMFDPPVVKSITGPCPACSESTYFTLDGAKQTALIAYYWKGIQPEAKCQRCGERWSGERELLDLGYHIGASVDEGALHEMGVL